MSQKLLLDVNRLALRTILDLSVLLLLTALLIASSGAEQNPSVQPIPEVAELIRKGDEARSKFQWSEALPLYEAARKLAIEKTDRVGDGVSLYSIGYVYYRIGQPQKSLEHHERALPILREVGDRKTEAKALGNIGEVYFGIGQPQKSLDYFQQTFAIYKELGDKGGQARTLSDLGVVYRSSGQSQKAEEHYLLALPIQTEIGDRAGQATTLNSLGAVYYSTGQYMRALGYFQQSLPIRLEIGDKRGEAVTLNNLGFVYTGMGLHQKALEYHQQALPIARAAGDRRIEALTLTSIGHVLMLLEQVQEALEYFQRALPIRKAINDKAGEAITLSNIGAAYVSLEEYLKALEYFVQSLPLSKEVSNKEGEAGALNNIGAIYAITGENEKALETYQQALVIYREIGDKRGEETTLHNIAELHLDKGERELARNYFEQGMVVFETVRKNLGNLSEAKQSYLSDKLPSHQIYLRLLLQSQDYHHAFYQAQRMKGRALLDRMGSVGTFQKLRLSEADQKQGDELRTLLQAANYQYQGFVHLGRMPDDEQGRRAWLQTRDAYRKQAEQADARLENFYDSQFSRYPELAKQKSAKLLSFMEIAKTLPKDTALLEYVEIKYQRQSGKAGGNSTVLFVVTRNAGKPNLQTFVLPLKQDSLEELSLQFIQASTNRYSKSSEEVDNASHELAQKLLPAKVLQAIAKSKRIVVCADGAIRTIPFHLLRPENRYYLLDKFEVSYAYSASHAAMTFEMKQRKQESPKGDGLLIVANPEFGGEGRFANLSASALDSTIASLDVKAINKNLVARRGGGIKPLPATKVEATEIGRLYPNAAVLRESSVQEARLKQLIPKYQWVHLATHGLLNNTAPMLSNLALAAPDSDREDGFLTAREIRELDLSKVEMMVLSACETAKGREQKGEGIVGLVWSLFAAGCPTQVVSLWKVQDDSTAEMMVAFYKNLKSGQTKSAALRSAALELRKKYAHPYHWAPFILVGDWR